MNAMNTTDNHTEVTTKINVKILSKEHLPTKISVKMDTEAKGNILSL